ncbi:histidine phosphatase family protein [Pseudoflavonifractor phocaeensis]|uniref:histidine phosphatase family protein n=1 Tax=Pseudoflavonifractor phocaeensis TaxID=1870988 RepID=UPI001959CD6E|nr:histidine phosphatase family protein [Pseudoflavonifractor phocaeensis]MBM6869449.1 histidine phosphatase family protein [Pseudoflavonifractor phocaeensis]MBM6937650.1 histidine phosphatase family protein [Pseudoflavonifractor phocaeensis]
MKVILVRHGATRENLEHRFLGVTDVVLAPQGAAEALNRAAALPPVDHVYVSPLIRCRQTAILLWPKAEMTVIPELRETDFGPFEGKCHAELLDDPLYNQWLACPDDPSLVPMVENVMDCAQRASRALESLSRDAESRGYETVGVVSHGGTLMGMLARHGRPERDYYSWRMDNCGGFVARLDREKLLLHVEESL